MSFTEAMHSYTDLTIDLRRALSVRHEPLCSRNYLFARNRSSTCDDWHPFARSLRTQTGSGYCSQPERSLGILANRIFDDAG